MNEIYIHQHQLELVVKGAIGSLQAFLGSLGADAGRPGSHGAMQKPTRAFRLVATTIIPRPERETRPVDWLAALTHLQTRCGGLVASCHLLMRYSKLFLPVVRIP
jgi:hypothetical protein